MAVKQEKGESARTSGEKPHGEEEVSSGACIPPCVVPRRGVCVAQPGADPPHALQQPRRSWASLRPRPWPEERPRPSLEGREAQAGLQAAPASCWCNSVVRSDPFWVVPFPLLHASR